MIQDPGHRIYDGLSAVVQGWDALDCKPGTLGKMLVFQHSGTWEGKSFEEKEVTVYYKIINSEKILLTVKARYGKGFLKGGKSL